MALYPDPELPMAEKQILQAAYPRLQTVTPTTTYRRSLGGSSTTDAPLEGQQIAISISDSPHVDGPAGFTKQHLDDAIVNLARTLICSGAAIAYGGAKFATDVDSALVGGATLDDAVKKATSNLKASENNEWANYILYGNGAFRLQYRQGA